MEPYVPCPVPQTHANKHGHKRKARMRQRQEELFESEVTLVYRESSRAARTT